MAACATRWQRAVAQPALLGLWLGALLVGCGGQPPAADSQEQGKNPPVSAIASPNAAAAPAAALSPPATVRRTFEDAIVEEPPEDQYPPPDRTKGGKSVGKLYEQITIPGGLWDQVVFSTADGKKLNYTATIKTDLGTIQMVLWPEVAPHHVRNFVALARAGYYDGLEFDYTVREKLQDESGQFFECLQAGCPLGLGDPHLGSIGYWLKPEYSNTVKHEEGTVGAWHDEVEADACRFYITLSKAPSMDGKWTAFGKVTQGLDVARTILTRPVCDDEFNNRPVQPVVIRSVTIETHKADGGGSR